MHRLLPLTVGLTLLPDCTSCARKHARNLSLAARNEQAEGTRVHQKWELGTLQLHQIQATLSCRKIEKNGKLMIILYNCKARFDI